jgi:murein DD-endopeptidase MepM/ murein hydrolase activator NlpD
MRFSYHYFYIPMRNIKIKKIILFLLCAVLMIIPLHAYSITANNTTILELNQQIQQKKTTVSNLRKRIEVYQKNIKMRQTEAANLENEIGLIEDSFSETTLDIEATQAEIDQLDLEVESAELEIGQRDVESSLQKEKVGEFLRMMYEGYQRDSIELFFSSENVSDFFNQVQYLEYAHSELYRYLMRIKQLKDQLSHQRSALEENKKRQSELKDRLVAKKDELEEKKTTKEHLIAQSILSKEKFQQLLVEARKEQQHIDNDIITLERTARERLRLLSSDGKVSLAWPVDSVRGISAYFHDPSYPYRYVYEHPAVDIRAYQGTSVKAAEAGYVARTKDGGAKGYSYIMILHDDGIATVYGHINAILVAQDTYVKKGQAIGLSGGKPGTVGAGPLTTGPHLHFEVRLNGIPVDPLKYLP